MLSMLRGPLTAGLIAISMLSCTADALGAAKIVRGTAATGEVATVAPSIGEQAFMRSRYWRMRTFAPYFNSRLSWAPDAWVTQHAYALEPAERAAHPEWQLTDRATSRCTSGPARPRTSATPPSAPGGSPRPRRPSPPATGACSSTTSSWSAART